MSAVMTELYLFSGFLLVFFVDLLWKECDEASRKEKALGLGWLTACILGIGILLGGGPFSTQLEAFGGAIYKTHLGVIFSQLFLFSGLLVVLCSIDRLANNTAHVWPKTRNVGEYYCLILLSLIGMCLIPNTRELLLLFVALELATIPLFILSAFSDWDDLSSEGAAKYLINGVFATAMTLFGFSFLYAAMGGDTFFPPASLHGLPISGLTLAAFVFVVAGIGFKVTAAPFHLWAPDVYQASPTGITAFLSVGSKTAGLAVFVVLLNSVFANFKDYVEPLFGVLAALTMTWGNLGAIKQHNIKRFLAYSSISQAGYIFLAFLSPTELGLTALAFYIFVYIAGNLAVFSIVAYVENSSGSVEMDAFSGMHRSHPVLALVMLLALFSLAGIPPLGGFFGKFWLFATAAEAGHYWLVVFAALNSVVSLYYYLGIIRRMYFLEADKNNRLPKAKVSPALGLGIAISATCMAGFILYPGVVAHIDQAARAFVGGAG